MRRTACRMYRWGVEALSPADILSAWREWVLRAGGYATSLGDKSVPHFKQKFCAFPDPLHCICRVQKVARNILSELYGTPTLEKLMSKFISFLWLHNQNFCANNCHLIQIIHMLQKLTDYRGCTRNKMSVFIETRMHFSVYVRVFCKGMCYLILWPLNFSQIFWMKIQSFTHILTKFWL